MLRLKELREAKGISQQALAIRFSISQSTISFYETDERSPDIETLIELAKFFNVSIDYLVGYSEVMKPIDLTNLSIVENNILHELKKLNKQEQLQVEAFIQGLSVRK